MGTLKTGQKLIVLLHIVVVVLVSHVVVVFNLVRVPVDGQVVRVGQLVSGVVVLHL